MIALFYDWKSYFCYNAFAVPLLLAVVLFFVGTVKEMKLPKFIALVILSLNIPYYLFRLLNNLIP